MNQTQIQHYQPNASSTFVSVFDDARIFDETMRMATALSKSALVPKAFQGSPESCLVAIDLARRLNTPVMTLFPHLYVIDQKPAFSTQFLITLVNRSGLFNRLDWETGVDGEVEVTFCDWKGSQKETWKATVPNHYAIAKLTERRSGKTYASPRVDMAFADRNGWTSKPGSKWQTMPEVMAAYRSASILIKRICPELTMGMDCAEDMQDAVEVIDVRQDVYLEPARALPALEAAPAANPVAELAATIERAESQEELDAAADAIKKAGVQGADRARLGKLYKDKQAALEPREPEPVASPYYAFNVALARADSPEELDSIRSNIELAATEGTLTPDEFNSLTQLFNVRASEVLGKSKQQTKPQKPTTSQVANYNGLLKALGDVKTKEDVAKLLKDCDGYVKKGLLTNEQGVKFFDACRKHEETLLI